MNYDADEAIYSFGLNGFTKKYIKHPTEVLSVGDIVKVWVIEVNTEKKRISLTMIDPSEKERK